MAVLLFLQTSPLDMEAFHADLADYFLDVSVDPQKHKEGFEKILNSEDIVQIKERKICCALQCIWQSCFMPPVDMNMTLGEDIERTSAWIHVFNVYVLENFFDLFEGKIFKKVTSIFKTMQQMVAK